MFFASVAHWLSQEMVLGLHAALVMREPPA
jgi:hypothetical protein